MSGESSADEVPEPKTRERTRALQATMFVASLGTMFYAGLQSNGAYWTWRQIREITGLPHGPEHALWRLPEVWGPALAYAVAFMSILFAHEMGHFITAKRWRVRMSWPLFIPFIPPLGSLGAVIAMEGRPMLSRALLRISAFGPFAGIVVAVPVIYFGLTWSEVRPMTPDFQGVKLGVCLLFQAIQWIACPPIPEGHDIVLHPVALAGWAGCLVTSINLLPFGQLDGGHIAYAMFGERFNRWVRWLFLAFALLVLVNPGFLLFAILIWFVVRIEHPPLTTDPPVTGRDRWIGRLAIVLFIVTFTPRPFLGTWQMLLGAE